MSRLAFGPTWAIIEQAYDSFIEDIGCEPKLIEVALDVWRKMYEEYPSKPQIEGGFCSASWRNTPIIARATAPPGKIYVKSMISRNIGHCVYDFEGDGTIPIRHKN